MIPATVLCGIARNATLPLSPATVLIMLPLLPPLPLPLRLRLCVCLRLMILLLKEVRYQLKWFKSSVMRITTSRSYSISNVVIPCMIKIIFSQ